MTSVSLDAWKIDPSLSSSRRSSRGVRDVAVVGDGDFALVAVDRERLRVPQRRVARRGISRVADRQITRQTRDGMWREDVRHMTHVLVAIDVAAVAGRDAGAFLAAMLKRVQAEVG